MSIPPSGFGGGIDKVGRKYPAGGVDAAGEAAPCSNKLLHAKPTLNVSQELKARLADSLYRRLRDVQNAYAGWMFTGVYREESCIPGNIDMRRGINGVGVKFTIATLTAIELGPL